MRRELDKRGDLKAHPVAAVEGWRSEADVWREIGRGSASR